VFINKTVLLPYYRQEYDTIAERIYKTALPWYKIIGIDSDNSSANIPYNIILAPLPKGLPTKCFIISTFLNTSITNSGNYAFSIKSFICSRTSLSNTFLSSFLIFYSSFVK
jgi:hypothetical protein